MTDFAERRRFPRVVRELSVKLSSDTFDLIAETQNISAAGANCLVSRPLPIMTRVILMILLPARRGGKPSTRRIRCEGVVVRSQPRSQEPTAEPQYETAIFFSNIKAIDQKAIHAYVERQIAEAQRTLESL